MLTMKEITRLFRVEPGSRLRLKKHDTAWAGDRDLQRLKSDELKEKARSFVEQNLVKLAEAQERLASNDIYSILVVLQAIDAAGKDGMVKHVMSGLNPQGCQVFSFKRPSEEELDHDFLWRTTCRLPERGRIGIFNRSYYEEVLVVRVHPEYLEGQKLPRGLVTENIWKERFEDINAFERYVTRQGIAVLKFFLNVSAKEQQKRFLARLDEPEKNWKFSLEDVSKRELWDKYMAAYKDMIANTSTEHAPWHVIPADKKWFMRTAVAETIVEKLEEMDPKFPTLNAKQRKALEEARALLTGAKDR